MTKPAVRSRLKALLTSMTRDQAALETALIRAALEHWMVGRGYQCLLATLPFSGEPDLQPFLKSSLDQGLEVALAMTDGEHGLQFGFVEDLLGPWVLKAGGLREPPVGSRLWRPGPRTLCLVPGLGFAPHGSGGAHRLGRGGGYFDRWLSRFGAEVFSLGIGFLCQTVEELPQEAHDFVLDAWLDPDGVHGS